MKRILLLALVVGTCCLGACQSSKNELGTGVPTIFTEINYPQTVMPNEKVPVSASLQNTEGLHSAWLVYYIDQDSKNPVALAPTTYNGVYTAVFQAYIPAQVAGKTITFQLASVSVFGTLSASNVFTYTVSTNN